MLFERKAEFKKGKKGAKATKKETRNSVETFNLEEHCLFCGENANR